MLTFSLGLITLGLEWFIALSGQSDLRQDALILSNERACVGFMFTLADNSTV